MFEKIKRIFIPEEKYEARYTRVFRKQVSKKNHSWLVVTLRGVSTAVQVPFLITYEQKKELEKWMVNEIKKKM